MGKIKTRNRLLACAMAIFVFIAMSPFMSQMFGVKGEAKGAVSFPGTDMNYTIIISGHAIPTNIAVTSYLQSDGKGGVTPAGADANNYVVKYAPSTNTLTLRNLNLTTSTYMIANQTNGSKYGIEIHSNFGWNDLNLNLIGENTIIPEGADDGDSSFGIRASSCHLNITGSGSLAIKGNKANVAGLWSGGGLTVNGPDIETYSTLKGIGAVGVYGGSLEEPKGDVSCRILGGSKVVAKASSAYGNTNAAGVECSGMMTVKNSTLIAAGYNEPAIELKGADLNVDMTRSGYYVEGKGTASVPYGIVSLKFTKIDGKTYAGTIKLKNIAKIITPAKGKIRDITLNNVTGKAVVTSSNKPAASVKIGIPVKKPAAPSKIKAKAKSKKSIKVTWKKSSRASYYKVYKATKKNGKYKYAGKTKKTYKTVTKLKKNKRYYFKIKAVNSSGSSKYSKKVSAKTKR
ncbi:MAG: fibronectin type III domain-containing protein [Eubacteriaceae bacterium]|nr:fibronectin type III domain-containing protein [Eubacteriaceae bacterium]